MNFIGGADAGAMLTWLGFDEGEGGLFPGFGPPGAATFALDLEDGYSVTWRWPSSVIKTRSGKEQRASRNDRAKESYEGRAYLFGQRAVDTRAVLARSAAQGSAFLLGLPHEALSMRLPSSGTTVYVHSTANSDWMNPGQRAVCVWRDPDDPETIETCDVTIQSTTADTIITDVAPGLAGQIGAEIMPAMSVYLEPEQAFPRWRTRAEAWQFQARAAIFDFAIALPSIALGANTVSAGLAAAVVTAKSFGQSTTVFALDNDVGYLAAGELREGTIGGEPLVIFGYRAGVTTIGDMVTALQSSTYVVLSGATDLAATLQAADDGGGGTLSGGSTQGPVGTGAALTTYASHPVWTLELDSDGEITDSIHALTEVIDHGGVPYAVGSADQADWGRTVIASGELGADFQWLKLFMATVKGPAKAFWLSTHRDDLPFVSKAAGTVTVEGDVGAWFPLQRRHIEIREASGTVTRAEIAVATNNGDGTYTLTIGTTLATSDVEMVSWLELVRFTRDEFVVEIDAEGWTLT